MTVQTPNTGVVSGTLLTNDVVVTSTTPVSPTSVLTDTEPTTVVDRTPPPVDLGIVKSAVPTPTVVAGNRLTYTLVVSNADVNPAAGVVVADALPAGVTYVSATSSKGVCGSGVLCTLGTLQPGETVVITVVVDVDADRAGAPPLINVAQVSSDQTDPNPGNNVSQTQTNVIGEAKLTIAKVHLSNPAMAGENLTYSIVVTNSGPSDAESVIITDTLPLSTTYVSDTDSCIEGPTGKLTCSLATIPASSTSIFQVTVKVASGVVTGTTLTNLVELTTTTTVGPGSKITDTETTPVATVADLAIDLTSPPNVVAGESMTVTANVSNLGPSDAAGTVVTVTLPPSTTFESIVLPAGWYSSTTGNNTLILTTTNPFTTGTSFTFPIVVAVDPATEPGTQLEFAGVVDSDTPDNDLTNNTDTTRTAVLGEADLELSKTGLSTVTAGETITYTVVITNNGPSTAQSPVLEDIAPAGVTVDSVTVRYADGSSKVCFVPTCVLRDLADGEVVTATVVGTVDSSVAADTILTNTATVASPTFDPTPGNNTDDHGTLVTNEANLVIAKRDLTDPTTAGAQLTYAVVVTNSGPSDAVNVVVTDTLPANTTHLGNTAGCTGPNIDNQLTCSLGTIPANSSTSFQVTVLVASGVVTGTTISNTVELTSGTPLGPNSQITDTETTKVQTVTDLSIDLSSPANVVAGESMTVTAVVANAGPSNAAGTVVTVTLPPSTTFESIVLPSGWFSATGPNNTVILTTSNPFTAGTNVTFPIVVKVDPATEPGTNLEFVGDVLSATPETNLLNNTDTTRTAVVGEADLVVDKSGQTTVVAGETITYTVVITNNGPSTAQSAVLADLVPAGIDAVSFSVQRATGTSSCGAVCLLGDVVLGEVVTVTMVGTVDSSVAAGAILTNTATVNSPTPDPSPNNNTDNHGTPVTNTADLVIRKTATPSPTVAGGPLTYVVGVTNLGPSDAQNVTVSDTLPAGFTVTSVTSVPAGCTGLPCNVGTVPAGGSASVTLVGTVASSATGALTNTASVTSTTTLTNTTNDVITITTPISTVADLAIDLSSPANVVAGESMTVTAVVANAGPSNALGTVVTVTLPPSTTFASVVLPSGWFSTTGTNNTLILTTTNPFTSGAGFTFPIVVDVDPATQPGTVLEFVGNIASQTPDPNLANNVDNTFTTVLGAADLSVVKSGTLTATAGGAISYTLVVSNAGPSAAQNVSVGDNPPAGVTVNSIVVVRTGSGVTACAGFACGLGTVAAGEVVTLTVFGAVDSAVTGVVTNTTTVASTTPDPVPGNNTDNHPTTVVALAKLTIEKTDLVDPIGKGESLIYNIKVTNDGPSDALNVVVTDTLPVSTTYLSNTDSCSGPDVNDKLTCSLGTIPAGQTVNFLVTVQAPTAVLSGTILTNNVSVTSTTPVSPTSVLTDTEPTTVVDRALPAVDLGIVKSAVPTPTVVAGTRLTYTLVVSNADVSPATGVVVADALPAGVTYVSATSSKGVCGSGVLCTLGTLQPGETVVITVVVDVDADQAGATLINVAQVSSDQTDPNPGNNVSQTQTNVIGEAKLTIAKTHLSTPAIAGENLTYSIVVTNSGPSDAESVIITDTLPLSTTYVSDTDSCIEGPTGKLTCSLATIPASSTSIFQVTVKVASGVVTGTTLTNLVELTTTTTVVPGSKITDTETTPVVRWPIWPST